MSLKQYGKTAIILLILIVSVSHGQKMIQQIPACGFYPSLKKQISEPVLTYSFISNSGRFNFHYEKNGVDAVPDADLNLNNIPDYIESAADIFDLNWAIQIDSLGYLPPFDINGDTVSQYHIYFQDLNNIYGITETKEIIDNSDNYLQYTSYIILDNDFQNESFIITGLNALKVVATHEFNHACQLSYRVWQENSQFIDIYFYEMTATWMEDIVYENIDGYLQYLPFFFRKFSNRSFNHSIGIFPYGNSLFLHMLETKYDKFIVPTIWKEILDRPSLESINKVLLSKNSSLEDELREYAIWLFYTGNNSINQNFFPEAINYPELEIIDNDIFNSRNNLIEPISLLPFSTRILKTEISENKKLVLFKNNQAIDVSHIARQKIIYSGSLNEQIDLTLDIGPNLTSLITNPTKDSVSLKLIIDESDNLNSNIIVFPNPVIIGDHNSLVFSNLPVNTSVYIFNLNGLELWRNEKLNTSNAFWNLKTNTGHQVSSGIYIYIIKYNNQTIRGKLAVIK